jgi:hypothetical protein
MPAASLSRRANNRLFYPGLLKLQGLRLIPENNLFAICMFLKKSSLLLRHQITEMKNRPNAAFYYYFFFSTSLGC